MNSSSFVRDTFLRLLAAALVLAIVGLPAAAQQGRGTILGTVSDSSGAVIPGAAVEVTNTATNVTSQTVTNNEGFYSVPDLLVGAYSVNVTMTGFKKAVRSGINLEVAQKAVVNLTLEIGAPSETVEVTMSAALLDTTTATVGKLVENRGVTELPLNGRNALSLVLLTPAVQSGIGPAASGFADRGTQISMIRINGSPYSTNNMMVDGLSSVNAYLPDVNINPNVDSVQEFKVQSNTMSAEYGFTLGGVINLVTKSGTNTLHGSLYEFLRNDALDANSWANNRAGRLKTPLRYNQYGGSVGGPVYIPKIYNGKDRTFFFYNYEGYQFRTSGSGLTTMPTAAMRGGDFSQLRDATGNLTTIYDPATTRVNPSGNGYLRDAFPGNIIPANRIDPVSKNFLTFYPLPNRTPDNAFTNLNNYSGMATNKKTLNQHTTRVDHKFSAQNSFSARYVYYRQWTDNGTSNVYYPDPLVSKRYDPYAGHNIVLTDLHVFSPSLVHEFRVGVARQIFTFTAASAYLGIPQKMGLPAIVPGDVTPTISNGLPGFNTGTIGKRGGVVWQLYDSMTWMKGHHSVKFGTEMRLTQANNYQTSAPSGSFNFSSSLTNNAAPVAGNQVNTGNGFATFLLGTVSSASVSTHTGESEVGKAYGFFINDEWRVSRRVSLSLGLRYDYQEQPFERNCGTSIFNINHTNPTNNLKGLTEYACKDYGRTIAENDGRNFAPRLGFSWDLFGTQKTVLRGGYGMFYSALFTYYTMNYDDTNGFASTSTAFNPPNGNSLLTAFMFKDGFPSAPVKPQGSALGPNFFATSSNYNSRETKALTPLMQQWNLSLQHQLPMGLMLEATYSGSHGTHLLAQGYDLNQADPEQIKIYGLAGKLTNSVANPYAGKVPGTYGGATITQSQALRPYPYLGGANVKNPHLGNSIYHSLLLSTEKRFSKGFMMVASLTYAKLISDSVVNPLGGFISSEGGNIIGYQNPLYNRRAERSEDASNVPKRFTLSALYELPVGKGKALNISNSFLNGVIGGWQINTITTIVSGAPLAVSGASNGLASRPDMLRVPELPSGYTDPYPGRGVMWFDTSAFVNPALYTYGNTPRAISQFRNPGAVIVDLSVFKTFPINDQVKLQFRSEFFNFPNHVNLGMPNTGFSPNAAGTNASDSFGRITTARDPRMVQFGLRLVF